MSTDMNSHNLMGMFIRCLRECGHSAEDVRAALQDWARMNIAAPQPPAKQDQVPLKMPQLLEIFNAHTWYDADIERYDIAGICSAIEAALKNSAGGGDHG